MANETLVTYVCEQLAQGAQKDAIAAAAAAQGWTTADINDAFAAAEKPAVPATTTPDVETPQVVITPKETAPTSATPTVPAASAHSNLWLWVGLGALAVVVVGGAVAWFVVSSGASDSEQPIVEPEAVQPEELSQQYSFTPATSTIPAFTFSYPASLETPEATEGPSTLTLTFPSIESVLTFSVFPSPLDEGQLPEQYFSTNFPTATVSFSSAGGHTLAMVSMPDFALDQIVYYIFLDDRAMTIDARGTVDARVIESIQVQ